MGNTFFLHFIETNFIENESINLLAGNSDNIPRNISIFISVIASFAHIHTKCSQIMPDGACLKSHGSHLRINYVVLLFPVNFLVCSTFFVVVIASFVFCVPL